MMLIVIIALFALAALLGVYLLTYVLKNKNTPKGIAFTHGPIAATGLVFLIIYLIIHPSTLIMMSLILFLLAALGGFVLIYLDLTNKPIPKWLAIGHGTMAVLGFVMLLMSAYIGT